MISVRVIGVDQLKAALRRLPDDLQNGALAAALNKTAAKARTETVRAVTATYNMRPSQVRANLSIRRASKKQDTVQATLNVAYSSTGRRALNLVHFVVPGSRRAAASQGRGKNGARQQLQFKIRRDKPPVTIPGAFIGNGGRTVFRRAGRNRLPIDPLQVIDVPGMFKGRAVFNRVVDRTQRELLIETDRAVSQQLRKLQGGA